MLRPLLLVALVLAACSPAAGPSTTTAPPTDADVLAAAGQELLDAGSFGFDIALEGPPIPVEALGGLGLRSAAGVVVLPDRAEGEAGGSLGPLTIGTPFVAVGTDLWLTNPLDGTWIELDATEIVDIPAVLGPEGLPAVLAADVGQVVAEEVDGLTVFRGNLDTTRLSELTNGQLGAGVTALRATTDLEGKLALVVFDDPVEVARTWSFAFSDVGVGAEIAPPTG